MRGHGDSSKVCETEHELYAEDGVKCEDPSWQCTLATGLEVSGSRRCRFACQDGSGNISEGSLTGIRDEPDVAQSETNLVDAKQVVDGKGREQ